MSLFSKRGKFLRPESKDGEECMRVGVAAVDITTELLARKSNNSTKPTVDFEIYRTKGSKRQIINQVQNDLQHGEISLVLFYNTLPGSHEKIKLDGVGTGLVIRRGFHINYPNVLFPVPFVDNSIRAVETEAISDTLANIANYPNVDDVTSQMEFAMIQSLIEKGEFSNLELVANSGDLNFDDEKETGPIYDRTYYDRSRFERYYEALYNIYKQTKKSINNYKGENKKV